jgi:RNA binding exosome subunit
MSPWVRTAEVSFHIHATEDANKVKEALGRTLGIGGFESDVLYGHYGNTIIYNRALLDDAEAERLVKEVCAGLNSADKALILKDLDRHVDEKGTLFIRLDKQRMLVGQLALSDADPVRIKARLNVKGDRALEMIRDCLA